MSYWSDSSSAWCKASEDDDRDGDDHWDGDGHGDDEDDATGEEEDDGKEDDADGGSRCDVKSAACRLKGWIVSLVIMAGLPGCDSMSAIDSR